MSALRRPRAYLPSGLVFQRSAAFLPPLRPMAASCLALTSGGFTWRARTSVGFNFGVHDVAARLSEASWVQFRFLYGPVLMGWVR